MGFSIDLDWSEELKTDKWENVGRRVIEEKCKHKTQAKNETNMRYSGYCEECDHGEDTAHPMMNYVYPLEFEVDDKKVLEIVNKTNCTVMFNTETDQYFLTLCGGGMNLSQDIALAYIIAQKWLPTDLLQEVSKQDGLSQGGKDFRRIGRIIIEQSNMEGGRLLENAKRWKEILYPKKAKKEEDNNGSKDVKS
jgi:hypothetical protein